MVLETTHPLSEEESGQVYLELVDLIFMFRLPLVIITLTAAALGWLIQKQVGTAAFAVITAATVLLGVLRLIHMDLYRRRRMMGPLSVAGATSWDRQFFAGSVLFGLLLGLMCAIAIGDPDPVVNTLGYILCIGFGCGLVSRSGFRGRLTTTTIVALMMPVLASIGVRLVGSGGASAYQDLVLAVLLISFVFGGIETSRQAERVLLEFLVTKRKYYAVAHADPLTGAANRLLLSERFEAAKGSRRGAKFALHCLDLDHFKPVNDAYGHAAGDALLIAVTERLSRLLGPSDTLARVGGDEFIILQAEASSTRTAAWMASRVIDAVSEPFEINGMTIRIGVSVGTALGGNGSDLAALREDADKALYRAKSAGRNRAEMVLKVA